MVFTGEKNDIVGCDVLGAGENIKAIIAYGHNVCKYDMRFELKENLYAYIAIYTQSLCKLSEYTVQE